MSTSAPLSAATLAGLLQDEAESADQEETIVTAVPADGVRWLAAMGICQPEEEGTGKDSLLVVINFSECVCQAEKHLRLQGFLVHLLQDCDAFLQAGQRHFRFSKDQVDAA